MMTNENTEFEKSYQGKRVLVVDDDKSLCNLAKIVLEKDGYNVYEANSGEQALASLESFNPDAILLDIRMPGLDGYETCLEIRHSDSCAQIPIMMVSGQDDHKSIDQAYRSGSTDFTSKPVNWPELRQRLGFMLKARELSRLVSAKESSLLSLVQPIPDLILRVDNEANVTAFESSQKNEWGECDRESLLNAHVGVLKNNLELIDDVLNTGEMQVIETSVYIKNVKRKLEYRIVKDNVRQVAAIIRDVSDLHLARKRLHNLDYYNRITQFPNRYYLFDVLSPKYEKEITGVAAIRVHFDELDNIKNTLKEGIFAELLVSVVKRLNKFLETINDTSQSKLTAIYRLEGPEFVILYNEPFGIDGLNLTISQFIETILSPFNMGDYEIQLSPRVGCSLASNEDNIERLISKAGEAMKLASFSALDKTSIYLPEITSNAKRKLNMVGELRKGLDNEEFELFYQPQVDLKSNKIIGFESLIRWNSSSLGFVYPNDFIPLAEESGLILPIGDQVIDMACKQAATWKSEGHKELRIAVNISAIQVHKRNLVQSISDCLSKYNIDPCYFEIELTESVLAHDIGLVNELLCSLKEVGIRTAIDDFGTGYSSLNYLAQLPFDVLKIDHSFVDAIDKGYTNTKLVEAIISMGKSLELEVLAEGVETNTQKEYLISNLCDTIQGYLFCKPKRASEISALMGQVVMA